jgi:hypothetical protein
MTQQPARDTFKPRMKTDTSQIPLAEIERDEQDTLKDIAHLEAIVDHLRAFMQDTNEDRSSYRSDLLRFEGVLCRGQKLLAKIREVKKQNLCP